MCCSSSKLRIWIQITTTYLGFTPMECSWLEPSEIFAQTIRTSRNCFLASLRTSMCFRFGSGVLSSENIWWAVVSEGRLPFLQRSGTRGPRNVPSPHPVGLKFLSIFIPTGHFLCCLDVPASSLHSPQVPARHRPSFFPVPPEYLA